MTSVVLSIALLPFLAIGVQDTTGKSSLVEGLEGLTSLFAAAKDVYNRSFVEPEARAQAQRSLRRLANRLPEAIRSHERVLLIVSSSSMESEWVKTEIAKARELEVRQSRQVLFPIGLASFEAIREWECFDADTGKDSAREIREHFILDFSRWREKRRYQEAFQKLLNGLRSSGRQS